LYGPQIAFTQALPFANLKIPAGIVHRRVDAEEPL
jgi:hypothetical protein